MKKLLPFLFFSFISLSLLEAEDNNMPAPYSYIKPVPFDGESLFNTKNQIAFDHLIKTFQIKTVVEIGSHLGASTRYIANLLPDDGKIFAVDHWKGNAEWDHKEKFQQEKDIVYLKFLSNVIHADLCDKIIPMRMSSLEAAQGLNILPDLVYLDGSHDTESVLKDLKAWWPKVKGHGILCGDDWGWGATKPVQKAVRKFAKMNRLHIDTDGWFWRLEE